MSGAEIRSITADDVDAVAGFFSRIPEGDRHTVCKILSSDPIHAYENIIVKKILVYENNVW